jgi:hypothetical protein
MNAARFRPGAISDSSSSHLPPSEGSKGEAGDVPARLVESRDETAGDGIAHVHKDDRDRPHLSLDGNGRHGSGCDDDVWL